MIFSYLKYISPIWYFNLRPLKDWSYFPSPAQIETSGLPLSLDSAFKSEEGRRRDIAYRAFQIGYIDRKGKEKGLDVWQKVKLPAEDEYRFLRKNVHVFWVMYTLMIRLLTFHNPVKEIWGYVKSRDAQREDYAAQAIQYDDYVTVSSTLIESKPLVSVVIPTLNRYTYLENALKDLDKQDYKNFEVIIVDQSDPFNPEFYDQFDLNIQLIRQEEKALWLARNTAIKISNGQYIALYEDDVRIEKDWLSNHLRCLDFFKVDISAGVFFPEGKSIPKNRSYFRWAEQFATGNACLKKEVFKNIGLFDRQFEKMRMGDGEFGLRAYLAGFRSVSNPFAYCIDIKASEGGLRQMGSWDAFRPKSLFSPRPVPSVLYFTKRYFGNQARLMTLLVNLPKSLVPYHLKSKKAYFIAYMPLVFVFMPFLVWQAMRSWRISNEMLREGPKIENFH